MSLINILKKKTNVNLFTTPSHSQKFCIFPKFKQFYKYDISETDAYEPEEALELAQKKASKIYKTKATYFLTNGSSSGIIAAVLACTNKEDKVLIWDKAHQSHKNAVKLAGATPVFYELEKDTDWGVYTQTLPETIEAKLKEEKIKAVIVTSPSYEGIVSDIAEIKKVCKKYGSYLIVDEAHGALYPFCDKLPNSAIYQGADFVIQSLHKTAGGLNPTALLHCNISCHCETKNVESYENCPTNQSLMHTSIEDALNLISTTSPSYPLLASIEKNISYINSQNGRKKILELIENVEKMKKHITNCEFYSKNDPTKILVRTKKMNGFELSEFLFSHKIEDERTNEKSTMLLCGIGTEQKKINRLEKVLKKI